MSDQERPQRRRVRRQRDNLPDVRRYGTVGPAVVALKVSGATFTEIAQELGLATPADAQRVYLDYLAANVTDEDRTVARHEAEARLGALLRSTWAKATDPEHPEHLPAVRTAQGLIDRVIRLKGLDAPQEVVVYTPTQAEIEQWVNSIVEQHTDPGVEEPDIIDVEVVPPDEPGT